MPIDYANFNQFFRRGLYAGRAEFPIFRGEYIDEIPMVHDPDGTLHPWIKNKEDEKIESINVDIDFSFCENMDDGNLREFRVWLVMYTLDMLASSHQISWDEIQEGLDKVIALRAVSPVAPIPFPDCDVRMIKGHTPR